MNLDSAQEEQIAVGGPLVDHRVLDDVLKEVEPGDFIKHDHELILDAMATMSREGRPIDVVTVGDHLERTGQLTSLGGGTGRLYLHECAQSVPVALNAPYYAQIVRDRSNRRRLQKVGNEILQTSGEGSDTTFALESARKSIESVGLQRGGVRASSADAVAKVLDGLHRPVFMRTPWREVNRKIAGWNPQRLYVAGARPGAGKSTFLAVSALHAARLNKGTIIIFSMEMSQEEMVERFLVNMAEVDSQRVLHRSTSEEDDQRMAEAGKRFTELDIIIEDDKWTVDEMRSYVRDYQKRAPVAMVAVDYLQEIKEPPGPRLDEHLRIARDARALKSLSTALNVPVLALAQLKREADGQSRMPLLSDLAGSSGIEAAADAVMLMHRPKDDLGEVTDELRVNIEKHRQGPKGLLKLKFDGTYFRITDWPLAYDSNGKSL